MPLSTFAMPGAIFLVIDDSPENLRLLHSALTRVGGKVLSAASADLAREQLVSTVPDIILLDVVLPGTDGFMFCQELKANPRLAHIPVIFLSGLSDPMDKVKAFRAGGADYVSKPFEPVEVLARVNHHYRMLRMQQALQHEKTLLAKMNDELLVSKRETAEVFEVMAEQMRGKVLDGKYVLEDVIGSGGFATVYKARQLDPPRMVAVKILRPGYSERTERRLRRFRQEATSTARIHHPNMTVVYDAAFNPDGISYLVMELLDGVTLSEELETNCPLSLERCIQIIVPVCEVLLEAHRVGVLHRDIKPTNLFLHRQRGIEVVKVLDFGISKVTGEEEAAGNRLTQQGDAIGTACYMSPEQARGEPCDGRTDIYSVGVTLYEMLTGELPRVDAVLDGLGAQAGLQAQSPPPSALNSAAPPEIASLVLSTLSRSPSLRPTASELLQRLLSAGRALLGQAAVERLINRAQVEAVVAAR